MPPTVLPYRVAEAVPSWRGRLRDAVALRVFLLPLLINVFDLADMTLLVEHEKVEPLIEVHPAEILYRHARRIQRALALLL